MITHLDCLSDETIREALSTASISVEVEDFRDIFTATGSMRRRSTSHRMRLSRPHPRVHIDPEEPDTLRIKPRGATLRFTISPKNYFPIGIAFELRGGIACPEDEERLGFLNFDQVKIRPDGNSISVTDEFKDLDADDRYKFSIIIQRGSDGRIGIIDPGIRHEPH
jgi:hypothetical protein